MAGSFRDVSFTGHASSGGRCRIVPGGILQVYDSSGLVCFYALVVVPHIYTVGSYGVLHRWKASKETQDKLGTLPALFGEDHLQARWCGLQR